ncbi:MAG: Rieske 2Fe-2S domain-containing protein [Alphaproteobacteria bacterium]|nr:Rieske 2Fe-2S domain-containing protein [Alphaproteobacteria bacterium]
MLSEADNELLCRIGPGTPMGDVFRRFWLPVIGSSEIRQKDGPPKRLRVLGEDLIAFRNSRGEPGVISAYCPHKLAPLFFGRNEECGLRCAYHGWKFDTLGNCVEIPNLPPGFDTKALQARARIAGYPAREAGGMVWIYMGPQEHMPELPQLEWLTVPEDHAFSARWLQRSNWAQGMEGEIDSSHISWLHRNLAPSGIQRPVLQTAPLAQGIVDGAPVMKLQETDYGFVYGARRNTSTGDFYWRVTQWMAPMFSMIPHNGFPRTGRAWVPIDDYHTSVVTYAYRADAPFTREQLDYMNEGHSFPPPLRASRYTLPDGYTIDTFQSVAVKENDYMIDRHLQRVASYSGISATTDQDRALQENTPSGFGLGPGKIADRSRELLVASDLPVITARRILLKMAKDMREGRAPQLPQNPERFAVRSAASITQQDDFSAYLEAHAQDMRVPRR